MSNSVKEEAADTPTTPPKDDKKRSAPDTEEAAAAKKRRTLPPTKLFDIFIVAALHVEIVQAVCVWTETEDIDQFLYEEPVAHYNFTMKNQYGELIRVGAAEHYDAGPASAITFAAIVKSHFDIKHWFMTGICAGFHENYKLGDVIFVHKAVEVAGKLTDAGLKADSTHNLGTQLLQSAAKHIADRPESVHIHLPGEGVMPPTISEILDKLITEMAALTDANAAAVAGIYGKLSGKYGEAVLLSVIERGKAQQKLAERGGLLTDIGRQAEVDPVYSYIKANKDADSKRKPKVVISDVCSSVYVREDLPTVLKQLRVEAAARKITAVEMEIRPFYFAMHAWQVTSYIAAKGVCDFGDSWKDDAYHKVASQTAAAALKALAKRSIEPRPQEPAEQMSSIKVKKSQQVFDYDSIDAGMRTKFDQYNDVRNEMDQFADSELQQATEAVSEAKGNLRTATRQLGNKQEQLNLDPAYLDHRHTVKQLTKELTAMVSDTSLVSSIKISKGNQSVTFKPKGSTWVEYARKSSSVATSASTSFEHDDLSEDTSPSADMSDVDSTL